MEFTNEHNGYLTTWYENYKRKREHDSCKELVERMKHFIANPTTTSKMIGPYYPKTYDTSCSEFKEFVNIINNAPPNVMVPVFDHLLDKKLTIEPNGAKVNYICPIVEYDNVVYSLI